MTIIVEAPGDDLAAWIGVAGVAVGVMLTTGAELLRDRLTARRQHRREVLAAAAQLTGAANTMASLVNSYAETGTAGRADAVGWTLAMSAQSERANDAAVTIIRLAPAPVAEAATTIRLLAERINDDDLRPAAAYVRVREDSKALYDALAKAGFLPGAQVD